MIQLEPQINKEIKKTLSSLSFSCPAKVVSIRRIKEGLIDVKPLVNKLMFDYEYQERPTIHNVPIITPSTITSAIILPVSEGDTVQLIFNGEDIDEFKDGNINPHNPRDFSLLPPTSAVAIIGLNTTIDSIYDNANFTNNIDNEDLNIIHNIGEDNETLLSFKKDGEVLIKSKSVKVEAEKVGVIADTVTVDATEVDAKASIIRTDGDVLVKGLSVYNNMIGHTHVYTDNGSTMVTAPPTTV